MYRSGFEYIRTAFIKLTNLLQMNVLSVETVWEAVRSIRFNMEDDKICDDNNIFNDADISLEKLLQLLNVAVLADKIAISNISMANFKNAGEMFIYLNFCIKTSSGVDTLHWKKFYRDLLIHDSPNKIVFTMNRVLRGFRPEYSREKDIARRLFLKISSLLSLGGIKEAESVSTTGHVFKILKYYILKKFTETFVVFIIGQVR